jgi:type I restriction-modification system specificity subunit
MNKQQEPRLRFKEFAGAWEEKVLGENASFTKGSGYSKSDLTDSGFPIILYGRLYTKYENIIENVDTFVSCDKNALKSLGNEVIVPASGETAEDIARASAVYQQDVILGGDLNIITPNENIASPFLALTLTNGKSNQELAKKAQGKSVVHLRNDDLRACKISFPSFLEQTHLGLFFSRLDSQIAESRAVLEKSRQLKKAMLAKMFPANGEKIPEIRFKGFDGEWEYRKLGEVASSYSGGTPSVGNSKFYGGNIPFIRSGEIHSSKTELFLTQEGLESSSAKLVKQGDILYALYGATSGEVERSKINGAINQAILAIIPNENYDAEFISQWLKNNKENIVNLYLQGGQGNLSGEIVKKIEISFPTKKEQTAIGNFFRQLDETIALQSAEVEKLNQLKKGLLAAMLV